MNPWKISTFALAALLAVTVSFSVVATIDAGTQGNMESALEHLDKSEQALLEAAANKDGHRVKAIKLVRAAKLQVKKGIAAGEENSKEK